MMPTFKELLEHALASPGNARDEAKWVMTFDLPRDLRWSILAIVVLLNTILTFTGAVIEGPTAPFMFQDILMRPFLLAVVQMSGMVITVFLVFWVGQMAGGHGNFGDGITLIAWLQFIMTCLQAIQVIAALTVPPLAGIIAVVAMGLMFWLMTNFIAEMHGFKSLTKVFVMIIATIFAAAFAMSFILTLIGVSVPTAGAV